MSAEAVREAASLLESLGQQVQEVAVRALEPDQSPDYLGGLDSLRRYSRRLIAMWEQGDVLVTRTLARRAAGRRADRGPAAGEELLSSLAVQLEAARPWADRRALAAA